MLFNDTELNVEVLEIESDLHTRFYEHIIENMIDYRLLAKRLYVGQTYMRLLIQGRRPFPEKMRKRMNDVLKTNF